MKKTALALALLFSITTATYAGDIPTPPRPSDPPPCTENCIQSEEPAPTNEQNAETEKTDGAVYELFAAIGHALGLF